MKREYTIIDEAGLHARPASLLVALAGKFENDIDISYKDKTMTLKSIIAVMSLGVSCGATFSISVSGEDAEEVLGKLEDLLKKHKLV